MVLAYACDQCPSPFPKMWAADARIWWPIFRNSNMSWPSHCTVADPWIRRRQRLAIPIREAIAEISLLLRCVLWTTAILASREPIPEMDSWIICIQHSRGRLNTYKINGEQSKSWNRSTNQCHRTPWQQSSQQENQKNARCRRNTSEGHEHTSNGWLAEIKIELIFRMRWLHRGHKSHSPNFT